ncbi:hypothetical protein [Montanilutibacter psychrotolerans]|uniref:DUF4864 domain-containing protein n=1 Tax=Montanilutibacter psychrotolerans TaxID=1327343 RepID=A0A3M8SQN1_9GAMM|nr:hypothetical protein [Lysobacter psychrotolerans]RNF83579.1 hypothetical protein EER27_09290 [Lysobacter psychrotolerans]
MNALSTITIALVALLLSGCAAWAGKEPMNTNLDDERPVVTLALANDEVAVGLPELEQLKAQLLLALRRANPADFGALADELGDAKCFIAGGSGHIGAWQLGVRRGEAVLVRQQMPRAPMMLFHVARVSYDGGIWQVQGVSIEKVSAR